MNRAQRKIAERRMATARAVARDVVASGKCPDCASGLRRNLALTGWWQCEQFGAEGFRARSNDPACSWQGFTE